MDSILAGIAQLVEHRIRNAKVSGSIPLSGKFTNSHRNRNDIKLSLALVTLWEIMWIEKESF